MVLNLLSFGYWAWLGTFALILLTYQDMKKMRVDDRKNWFMSGVTISLLSHIPSIGILYLLALVIITAVLGNLFKRFDAIGEADITTLSWIFFGLALISVYKLLWFAAFFLLMTSLYSLVKWIYLKKSKAPLNTPTPFYPVLLISFIFNCWLFGLYGL